MFNKQLFFNPSINANSKQSAHARARARLAVRPRHVQMGVCMHNKPRVYSYIALILEHNRCGAGPHMSGRGGFHPYLLVKLLGQSRPS